MTVILPTPYELLVDKDGKINEVWYRYFSQAAIATNGLSSALSAITTASTVSLTFATQADQEASTAPAAIVTPSVQQYHPSAAKAWGTATIGVSTGAQTILASYNVSAVTKTSAGSYTVEFTTPFSSTAYTILPIAVDGLVAVDVPATTGFQLFNDTTVSDPLTIHFACYGDQ
jgi:hypothetical protein